ncbi:hypothetical protein CRENBAI_008154 [Crenichthys baileyi]|uniref:Uncharacterized protein n=1 Tax=Crenichthys baileyi TaxID=28760 RepID=A0AAV9SFZ9_9TELE
MVPAHYLQIHLLKKNRRTQLRGTLTCPSTLHRSSFSPRKKGQFFLTGDHRYQLAHCLPTTDAVVKDFIPLPPYPASHSSLNQHYDTQSLGESKTGFDQVRPASEVLDFVCGYFIQDSLLVIRTSRLLQRSTGEGPEMSSCGQ